MFRLKALGCVPAEVWIAGGGVGGGDGEDMMSHMAPMMEMMKAKMGMQRFAAWMQTMGTQMVQHEGGGGDGDGLRRRERGRSAGVFRRYGNQKKVSLEISAKSSV